MLNADGSFASSITFTSVDGGVDDGDGWPFPDGRLGRPLHTWLSVGAMQDRFTAEAVGVRRGAAGEEVARAEE